MNLLWRSFPITPSQAVTDMTVNSRDLFYCLLTKVLCIDLPEDEQTCQLKFSLQRLTPRESEFLIGVLLNFTLCILYGLVCHVRGEQRPVEIWWY